MAQLNRRLIQLFFVLVALILVPGMARAQKNKEAAVAVAAVQRRTRRPHPRAPVIGWRWKPS